MGIGGTDALSLKDARDKAIDLQRAVARGVDPILARKDAEAARQAERAMAETFGEFTDRWVEGYTAEFRNAKHADQWRMTLRDYTGPIRNKRLADIDFEDIVKVLEQVPKKEAERGGTRALWAAAPETARRLRGRIEIALAAAKAEGLRDGPNPAELTKDLTLRMKRHVAERSGNEKHHAAMNYKDLPEFITALLQRDGIAARALEFLILTAARSGEVRGAVWSEFDLEGEIPAWGIPAERMKAKRAHDVPLSDRAVEILTTMQPDPDARHGLVFPGDREGKPLSDMTLAAVLKRMKLPGLTVHGFRSSFRDWVGEETEFQHEIAEAALAHVIRDKTVRAYRRGNAFIKRAVMMTAWADYIEPSSNKQNEDGKQEQGGHGAVRS
jgi:integrase